MKKIYTFLSVGIIVFFFNTIGTAQCWEEVLKVEDNFSIEEISFLGDFGLVVGGDRSFGGSTGVMLRTMNGGEDWEEIYYPSFSCCVELDIINDSTIVVASGNRRIYKSTNRGDDWELLSNPLEGISVNVVEVLDLEFQTPDKGWAVVDGYGLLYTDDGGASWSMEVQDGSLEDLFWIDSLTGVATGWNAYKTVDGGENWYFTGNGFDFEEPHTVRLQFVNDTLGYAMKYSGTLMRTDDAGESWEEIATEVPESHRIYDMYFVNDSVGFISYWFENKVFGTRDGGYSWKQAGDMPNYESTLGIYMQDEAHGFVTTVDGYLLRYNSEVPPSCAIRYYANEGIDNLFATFHWSLDLDYEGCLDGFELRLSNTDSTYLDVIDVGLVYSYTLDYPLPYFSGILYQIIPYSNLLGTNEACNHDGVFTGTEDCPDPPLPIDTFICVGEDFAWDGHVFSETGVYEIPYWSDYGCDSTITLNLQWYEPPVQTVIDTGIVAGMEVDGVVYEQDTIFSVLLPSVNGCDSIVTYVINIITATETPEDNLSWRISPNPTGGDGFYLMGRAAWQEAILYDTDGRVVQKWQGDYVAGRHRLELKSPSSGLYFLVIRSDVDTWTERLVVME